HTTFHDVSFSTVHVNYNRHFSACWSFLDDCRLSLAFTGHKAGGQTVGYAQIPRPTRPGRSPRPHSGETTYSTMPQHDHRHIQLLEELSLNAWPALQTVVYDGWLLRFAGGMSRRANSVQVLYPSSRPLAEKIDFCETHYERAGLPTAFKLTAAAPAGLHERPAQRGYRREGEISVQTLSLKGRSFEPSELATVLEQPESAWIDELCRLNH